MINGGHVILYSGNAEADRAFMRDVLKFAHVDVGDGWLIFKLPPSEIAIHPASEGGVHEFYLMCDDIDAEMKRLDAAGVACTPAVDQGWGVLTHVTLPSGGKLGLYEPRHARP